MCSICPKLKKCILEEGHRSDLSIHLGTTKVYQDLKKMFWWPGMKKDVVEFVYTRLTCKNLKIEHQKSFRSMKMLSIQEWKWDTISMDFVMNFLNKSKGTYIIWVVMDRLTKLAHFILIKISYPLQKLAEVYIEKIISLYGIPSSIVSDRYIFI